MKKVLIISYYFPPSGGAGVQRVLKFVKYLPQFGWEPIVLTVHEGAGFPARDPSLLKEIPKGIPVHRTKIFEPYSIYRKVTSKKKDEAIDIATLSQTGLSLSERFSRFIRSTFFIPDARCFWKKHAVKTGQKIIDSQSIDLIFSSAPPYTCHRIGQQLQKYSALPWVADFRDSWVGWLSAPKRWFLPHWIDRSMEHSVLRNADRCVTVSNGIREDLLSRNKRVDLDKWDLIPNGYDGEDFKNRNGNPSNDLFVLTYTGSLYGHRSPETLLSALERILQKHPELQNVIRIRFIGRVDAHFLEAFKRFGTIIQYIPYVPHSESIRMLLDSTALLLIIDDAPANQSIITGKLYEYIGAKRPILALAPEGEAAQLIRQLNIGAVVHPNDASSIQKALEIWLDIWKRKKSIIKLSDDRIEQFDRKNLTKQLADVFDGLV
jgi:glycosyltransferase involved in cell wall biosynthesis